MTPRKPREKKPAKPEAAPTADQGARSPEARREGRGGSGPSTSLPAGLAAESPEARAQAVHELGGAEDPGAVPALIAALDDPSSAVRAQAAAALGRFARIDVVVALASALRDGAARVRRAAAEALTKIGGRLGTIKNATRILPALLAALEGDPDRDVCFGVEAIGRRLRDPRAGPQVLPALGYPNGLARATASRVMTACGWTPSTDEERAALVRAALEHTRIVSTDDEAKAALARVVQAVGASENLGAALVVAAAASDVEMVKFLLSAGPIRPGRMAREIPRSCATSSGTTSMARSCRGSCCLGQV